MLGGVLNFFPRESEVELTGVEAVAVVVGGELV